MQSRIPFHQPYENPEILKRTLEKMSLLKLDKSFALEMLEEKYKNSQFSNVQTKTYFTQSATQALEMMALAMELTPNDEIIMPSYTYAATANAFARTGAKILFADIEKNTLNISPRTVAPLLSKNTKAIIPIHYGGSTADLTGLKQLVSGRDILLLEDAAHGLGAFYKERPLGTIGEMGCISFHQTKNIHAAGSGGLLTVRLDQLKLIKRCDQIYHQGTNRLSFIKGNSSNYSWHMLGGEYQMSPYHAIYLTESLDYVEEVTLKRQKIAQKYQSQFEANGEKWRSKMSLMKSIEGSKVNGHIFPIVLNNSALRNQLKQELSQKGIDAFTHYEPLHLSRAGSKYGTTRTEMTGTHAVYQGLLRLPSYDKMKRDDQERVIEEVLRFMNAL